MLGAVEGRARPAILGRSQESPKSVRKGGRRPQTGVLGARCTLALGGQHSGLITAALQEHDRSANCWTPAGEETVHMWLWSGRVQTRGGRDQFF